MNVAMMKSRQPEHERVQDLDELLTRLNDSLVGAEDILAKDLSVPRLPPVFIVGCPRGGTTLAMQVLASTGAFSYPSNFISRFYQAPSVGAIVQRLLTSQNLDKHDEMQGFEKIYTFGSNLGKTKGLLSPNEFWYFWRRFFKVSDTQYFDNDALYRVDSKRFLQELAGFESILEQPLLMKALFLNWNLPYLANLMADALFVNIERNPYFNMQSLIQARRSFFGDINEWYSFKPAEYAELIKKNPYHQVAGQIFYTNNAIQDGLKNLPKARTIRLNYKTLCENPRSLFDQVKERLRALGLVVGGVYTGPEQFPLSNTLSLSDGEVDKLLGAYKQLSGLELSLEAPVF